METTNNFKLKEEIKSFYNAWIKCRRPKKIKNTTLNNLKMNALVVGLFTIACSTMFFATEMDAVYNNYDSKPDNSTSSASLNQMKADNLTTSDNEKQNLKNSTTDGDNYLRKQSLLIGFPAICGIILYVHIINSSFMLFYGALKECKHLLLPWIISAPTTMIGFMISLFFHPNYAKIKEWAIYFHLCIAFSILYITFFFLRMIEYFSLLAERDRVKMAIANSRPIPTVLPGEIEY